jgi:hypothetical protein
MVSQALVNHTNPSFIARQSRQINANIYSGSFRMNLMRRFGQENHTECKQNQQPMQSKLNDVRKPWCTGLPFGKHRIENNKLVTTSAGSPSNNLCEE